MTDTEINEWMEELSATGADVSLDRYPGGWVLTIVDWDHEGIQDEYEYTGITHREAIEHAVSATRKAGETNGY